MSLAIERPVKATPIVTYCLIAANIAIFVLFPPGSERSLYGWGATNRLWALQFGEYYRLVSAMFLHANLLHLAFNMYALYRVGQTFEGQYGAARTLLVYFLGGIAGSVVSLVLNAPNVSSVGASGAVFALFGAEIVYYYQYRHLLGSRADEMWQGQLWIVTVNFINGLRPDSGIDNWAHLGGLVGGAITVLVINLLTPLRPYPEPADVLAIDYTRQRHFTVLALAAAFLVLALAVTAFPTLASRQVTVDNIKLNIPAGWHVITKLDGTEFQEFCGQSNVKCLAVASAPDGFYFEITRFTGLGMLLVSLEQFDESFASQIADSDEWKALKLVSKENRQVSGQAAIQRIYQSDQESRALIFIKDSATILRFLGQGGSTDVKQLTRNFETMVQSIQFVNR